MITYEFGKRIQELRKNTGTPRLPKISGIPN